ncbi:unnamed protein product [Scytosiphon promiscuus]
MAKGSKKKRRPKGGGGAGKNAPSSSSSSGCSSGGVPPLPSPGISVENGVTKRLGDGSGGATAAAAAASSAVAPRSHRQTSGGSASTGDGVLGEERGVDGRSLDRTDDDCAAAAAAAAASARGGVELEVDAVPLATSAHGSDNGAAVTRGGEIRPGARAGAEARGAAAAEEEEDGEEEPDGPVCEETDAWTVVDSEKGNSASRGEAASLDRQEGSPVEVAGARSTVSAKDENSGVVEVDSASPAMAVAASTSAATSAATRLSTHPEDGGKRARADTSLPDETASIEVKPDAATGHVTVVEESRPPEVRQQKRSEPSGQAALGPTAERDSPKDDGILARSTAAEEVDRVETPPGTATVADDVEPGPAATPSAPLVLTPEGEPDGNVAEAPVVSASDGSATNTSSAPDISVSCEAPQEVLAGPAAATADRPASLTAQPSSAESVAGDAPHAAGREVSETVAVPPPPPFSSMAARDEASPRTQVVGGQGEASAATTAAPMSESADGFGGEKAAGARATAAAAATAATVASTKAKAAAEAAAQVAARAGVALGAVAAAGTGARGDFASSAGAPPFEEKPMRGMGNIEVIRGASADRMEVPSRVESEAWTADPAVDLVETPAVPKPAEKAMAGKSVVQDAHTPVPAAAAAPHAAVEAAATPATQTIAAESIPADGVPGDETRTATSAGDDVGDAAAAPPVVALPPLFSECLEDAWESGEASAGPTGAMILSGSVGADVFSSRSGGGPCPWPGSSEDEDDFEDDDDDGGDDDDDANGKQGLGGSSRHRMTVAEAAAFMNLGSATNGSAGAGTGFASGSSWAMAGTSAAAADTADGEHLVEASDAGAASEHLGSSAARSGAAAAVNFATYGGVGRGVGAGGADGSRPLSLGASLSRPFFGTDDFLSPSAVGMGLRSRRLSCDAALLSSFSASGGAAKIASGMGARRSTAIELFGRGGDGGWGKARRVTGGGVPTVDELEVAVVGEGDAARDISKGVTGDGDDVRPTPPAQGVGAKEEMPSASKTEEEEEEEEHESPALVVSRAGGTATARATKVVEGCASDVAAQDGNAPATAPIRAVHEGSVVTKKSDGVNVFAASESAATSFAGAEGEVGSPSRGADAAGAGRATPVVGHGGGGGCCVVS